MRILLLSTLLLLGSGCLLSGCESSPSKKIDSLDPTVLDQGSLPLAPQWQDNAELSVVELTATTLTLSWPPIQMDDALLNYQIHQDNVLLTQVDSLTHQITLSHLEPNQSYLFSVNVVDQFEQKSTSLDLEVTTPNLTDMEPKFYL